MGCQTIQDISEREIVFNDHSTFSEIECRIPEVSSSKSERHLLKTNQSNLRSRGVSRKAAARPRAYVMSHRTHPASLPRKLTRRLWSAGNPLTADWLCTRGFGSPALVGIISPFPRKACTKLTSCFLTQTVTFPRLGVDAKARQKAKVGYWETFAVERAESSQSHRPSNGYRDPASFGDMIVTSTCKGLLLTPLGAEPTAVKMMPSLKEGDLLSSSGACMYNEGGGGTSLLQATSSADMTFSAANSPVHLMFKDRMVEGGAALRVRCTEGDLR